MSSPALPQSISYADAFLDIHAKKEIRRGLLAIAIPGHLVPYSSREMPMARGFVPADFKSASVSMAQMTLLRLLTKVATTPSMPAQCVTSSPK